MGRVVIASFLSISPRIPCLLSAWAGRKGIRMNLDLNLRGIHLLAPEHQLSQLETDFAVVNNKGNLAYIHKYC